MTRIGIRELKNQTSRIVGEVREKSAHYVVTLHGRPVAVLHPYTAADAEAERRQEIDASLAELKRAAHDVAQAWTSPKTAVELLDEQRR